jgi:hypothetical protein
MVVSILVGDNDRFPDHLPEIHRGEIRLSPMVYRGFVRGEMSPPTAITIVSLSGGTHPAMDAVSVQSLVSVSSPPRSDGLTIQADRGQHCGGSVIFLPLFARNGAACGHVLILSAF